jgi:hypothetical protein
VANNNTGRHRRTKQQGAIDAEDSWNRNGPMSPAMIWVLLCHMWLLPRPSANGATKTTPGGARSKA